MANLPDLDTTSIGFIAYWNAIDQGGLSSVDPDEVLSASSIDNYTLYDNGVEGVYTGATGRNLNFRVKTDGWFVAYFDRTADYTTNTTNLSNHRGPWDVANDWTSGTSEIDTNTLERAINDLSSQLSSSPSYNKTDVGLYDYERPNVTTVTVLSATASDDTGSYSFGFSYTSGTTRALHALVGRGTVYDGTNNRDSFGKVISPGSTAVVDAEANGSVSWGSYDLLGNAEASEPATEYEVTHEFVRYDEFANPSDAAHTNFIMWY